MSKVKEAIELALENVNNNARNTYGARIYTFEQVAMVLQDILETANEAEPTGDGTAVVTRDVMDDLVEKIHKEMFDKVYIGSKVTIFI
jgi:urease gamma subunit